MVLWDSETTRVELHIRKQSKSWSPFLQQQGTSVSNSLNNMQPKSEKQQGITTDHVLHSMRGDNSESDGNLQQLLRMKAVDSPNLAEWLKRKENVYTSPDIQNEIIKIMGIQVLQEIIDEL